MIHLVLLAVIPSSVFSSAPCGDLTTCAVEKCLDSNKVRKIVHTSSRESVFGDLVEKFDLICIASKCSSQCQSCKQCQYALEQMTALAQGEQTSGLCPKLESCVMSCIADDITHVLECVASRCNVHCYDGDCPSCKIISKRMFTQICKQHNMPSLPNIQFDGNCPNLFKQLSEEYVAARRRLIL